MVLEDRVPRPLDADEAPVRVIEAAVLQAQHFLRGRPYKEEKGVPIALVGRAKETVWEGGRERAVAGREG